MTKPVGVNAQLATTCLPCGTSMMTLAYPNLNHGSECLINQFLTFVETEKLKIVNVDEELDALLKTAHGLPFYEYKFEVPNGHLHAVYAPNWVFEGLNMYYNMYYAGMSMGEFLTTLIP